MSKIINELLYTLLYIYSLSIKLGIRQLRGFNLDLQLGSKCYLYINSYGDIVWSNVQSKSMQIQLGVRSYEAAYKRKHVLQISSC